MGLYWVYYRKHISVEASLLQAHPKTPGKSVRPQDPTNKVSPVMSSPALRCFPKKRLGSWVIEVEVEVTKIIVLLVGG